MSEDCHDITTCTISVTTSKPQISRSVVDDGSVWIETVSGRHVNLLNPRVESIDIGDIAHSLSQQCRFVGQCSRFYSVAEHSVWVSDMLPENLKLAGLLHDASEAYLGDVTAPLKSVLQTYKAIEGWMQMQIDARFGILMTKDMKACVKAADMSALKTEARHLMSGRAGGWDGMDGVVEGKFYPQGWSPRDARCMFLRAFGKICGCMEGMYNEAARMPVL